MGPWVHRLVTFLVGALGMAVLSVVAAFNVYSNALKTRFNYTQSEVELFASLGVVGQFFGIPASMLYHSYGPRATSVVGLVISVGGFLLVWMAVKLNNIFKMYSFVVSIFFFIGMHGTVYSYLGLLMANMDSFTDVHRGKVVAALNTLYQAPFFPFIYNMVFIGSDRQYHSNDNLEGFFLTLVVCFGVINLLGIIFLRKSPPQTTTVSVFEAAAEDQGICKTELSHDTFDDTREPLLPSAKQNSDLALNDEAPTTKSLTSVLTNWSFHFAAWIPVFSFAVNIMYLTNITFVLHSLDMYQHQVVFTVVCPLIGLVVSFTICTLSSRFTNRVRPSVVTLVLIILQTISQVLLIFFASNFPLLLACSIVEISSSLAIFSLIPTIVSANLGVTDFNRVWGYVLLMTSLATLALLKSFGAIYDSYLTEGETFCAGSYCFTYCFLMSGVVCGCATVFNLGLVEKGW